MANEKGAYLIKWRKKNPERVRLYRKRSYIKEKENPERLSAVRKKSYLKHIEKRRLESRVYYFKNRDKISKRHKEQYPLLKKSRTAYKRSYYLKNRQRFLYRAKIRKYLFRGAGKLTVQDIQKIYEDNIKTFGTLTCVYCKKSILFGKDSIDHIIPLSRGGTNNFDNLTISCISCNISKGVKSEKEYREWLMKTKDLMLVN